MVQQHSVSLTHPFDKLLTWPTMFARVPATLSLVSLISLAVATPWNTPTTTPTTTVTVTITSTAPATTVTEPASKCTTGPIQCCNSTQKVMLS